MSWYNGGNWFNAAVPRNIWQLVYVKKIIRTSCALGLVVGLARDEPVWRLYNLGIIVTLVWGDVNMVCWYVSSNLFLLKKTILTLAISVCPYTGSFNFKSKIKLSTSHNEDHYSPTHIMLGILWCRKYWIYKDFLLSLRRYLKYRKSIYKYSNS